jgi:hypothetical protein
MSPRQVGDDQILHTEPVGERRRPVAAGHSSAPEPMDDVDLDGLPF